MSVFDQQFTIYAAPAHAEQFGILVKLVRSGDPVRVSAAFTASFSQVADETEQDADALGTNAERRLWWMLRTDCVLNGSQVRPRAGDVLRVVDSAGNATGEKFEIAPNGSNPATEEHPDGVHWVANAKKIGSTTTTTTTTTTAAP